MTIADSEIKKRMIPDRENDPKSEKLLIIHPLLDERQIQGCKIDLRLDNVFYSMKHYERPLYDPMIYVEDQIEPPDYRNLHTVPYGTSFVLQPGEFIMAPLFEVIKMPRDLEGRLDGRSSLGRLGVLVHSTAGSVDPGYVGPIMMELCNLGKFPVKLFPLMRVAALTLTEIKGDVETSYSEKTQTEKEKKYGTLDDLLGAPSKLHLDRDLHIIKEYYNNQR